MTQENTIKIGQTATIIFPWREDEKPTEKNFFTGVVLDIFERSQFAFYARIAGLDNPVPLDRLRAV